MHTYNQIDQQVHQLAQTIAKFNRTYANTKEDDSHTNLAFDAIENRLLGRWVKSPQGSLLMSLDLQELKFEIFDKSWNCQLVIEVLGKYQREVEKKIETALPELGVDSTGFIEPLHFKIPEYPFAHEKLSQWPMQDLELWSTHRSLANDACLWLLNHLQVKAEIRIWPHHFDTGIYMEVNEKLGLGFGLAMQDTMLESPYYYLKGYSLSNQKLDYDAAKTNTAIQWLVSEDWKGAVLRLNNANPQSIKDFLKNGVDSYYSAL